MLQQLSTPYFDQLTVQENLFFCAIMRMDKNSTVEDKMERVQAVLQDVRQTHTLFSFSLSQTFVPVTNVTNGAYAELLN